MKTKVQGPRMLLNGLIAVLLIWPGVLFAGETTVMGEVNDQGEIIASQDGTIYRVADGEMGQKLVAEHIGDKVQARGRVVGEDRAASDDDRMVKLFEVISYKVLPE